MPKNNKHLLRRWTRKLHRYLGITALLLLLFLSITGIFLNHTDTLKLDQRFVNQAFLLDWYGIEPPPAKPAFQSDNHWFTQLGSEVYLNTTKLLEGELRGVVSTNEILAVATPSALLLLTTDGELIETMTSGFPTPITQIGITPDGFCVVKTSAGLFQSDVDLLMWTAIDTAETVSWSTPEILPNALQNQLHNHWRTNILPLERILLDIHSGRILGKWGVLLMDLAAIALILLGVSGLWMWLRRA